MELVDRVVFVTGAARGIGAAACRRIAGERPRGLVIVDRDMSAAVALADELGALAIEADVSQEAAVQAAVGRAVQEFGRVDAVISNAGVTVKGGFEVADRDWELLWQVNVMAHVYLARAAIPMMVEQGGGAFVMTASAAGVLTEIGSAPYSVTKHGTVAFAEWLSVRYRQQGLIVSCLCPAGVATEFLDLDDPVHQFLQATSVTAEQVAECLITGLREETFLLLPQRDVGEFFQFKTRDYDRWLHHFAQLNKRLQRLTAKARKGQSPPD